MRVCPTICLAAGLLAAAASAEPEAPSGLKLPDGAELDTRDTIPWAVLVVPGARAGAAALEGPCGLRRVFQGPRDTVPAMVAAARDPSSFSVPTPSSPPSAFASLARRLLAPPGGLDVDVEERVLRLPVVRGPGLLGEDGERLLVAAEAALDEARVPAEVSLSLDRHQAALIIRGPSSAVTADAVRSAMLRFSPSRAVWQRLEHAAAMRLARRRAVAGAPAVERVDRRQCFGVVEPPPPQANAAMVRAALHGPVLDTARRD